MKLVPHSHRDTIFKEIQRHDDRKYSAVLKRLRLQTTNSAIPDCWHSSWFPVLLIVIFKIRWENGMVALKIRKESMTLVEYTLKKPMERAGLTYSISPPSA